jgi:hypothetical protein
MKRYRGITYGQRQRVLDIATVLTTELRSIVDSLPKQDRKSKAIVTTLRDLDILNHNIRDGVKP